MKLEWEEDTGFAAFAKSQHGTPNRERLEYVIVQEPDEDGDTFSVEADGLFPHETRPFFSDYAAAQAACQANEDELDKRHGNTAELLAALQNMVDIFENDDQSQIPGTDEYTAVSIARAAVANAKGADK